MDLESLTTVSDTCERWDNRLHRWQSPYTSKHPTLYFRDGKRRIDYVLVFHPYEPDKPENAEKRQTYVNALAQSGLEYEIEDCEGQILGVSVARSQDKPEEKPATLGADSLLSSVTKIKQKQLAKGPPSAMERYRLKAKGGGTDLSQSDVAFVKLHAPWPTASRYAEILTLRKPLKKFTKEDVEEGLSDDPPSCCSCLELDRDELKPLVSGYTCPFQVKRQYLFDIPEDRDTFFTPVDRALICDYILKRTRFGVDLEETEASKDGNDSRSKSKPGDIGITKLLADDVYKAAYPLHEPDASLQSMYCKEMKEDNCDQMKDTYFSENARLNNRTLLIRHWATYKKLHKMQPLNYIRYSFGESIAFYFAWLGFYTAWLGPVAIIGVAVFLLGMLSIHFDPLTSEVCNSAQKIIMCPLCSNERCKYWTLSSSCFRFKLTRLIDNEGTVCFGILMALWAVLFLEMWKRRQTTLAFRWNVFSLEPLDQPARPEFLALLEKNYERRKNKISGMEEPYIPFWTRQLPFLFVSYTTVLFGVVLTLSAVVGVLLYKLVIKSILYKNPNPFLQSTAGMITTITGSVLNLLLIFLLKMIYDKIAVKMNDLEHHRTQLEYDNNLILKLYLLQFVNYYSTVFYIAFIQGTTSALPGSEHSPVQSTGCDQGDCLFELFLQLIIIMVGKQFMSFMQETLMPIFLRLIMRIRSSLPAMQSADEEEGTTSSSISKGAHLIACRADYTLLDPGTRPLFNEYLEMMIQFGFITMFVPAFPLAPFFGLLNNIVELRGDAKKFISQYRRPVLQRVGTIGIWFSILTVLSSIAIRTNACIIAFTTQFIDRWVYRFFYSPDKSLVGFVNFTLSYMPTDRFSANTTEEYCRYNEYRTEPWVDPNLNPTIVHYHVLAAKFIFVFLFETIAIVMTSFIATIVPDVPESISTQIFCETNITHDIIAHTEDPEHSGEQRVHRQDLNLDVLKGISANVSKQILSSLPTSSMTKSSIES